MVRGIVYVETRRNKEVREKDRNTEGKNEKITEEEIER